MGGNFLLICLLLFTYFALLYSIDSQGYYMYIETSSPRHQGDVARLISPATDGSIKQCFTFWYHMYGAHIQDLNIYFKLGNASRGTVSWTRHGTQGNRWIQGSVQIPGGGASFGVTNVSTS